MEEVTTLPSNFLYFAVEAKNYWRSKSSWQTGECRENLIHLVKIGRAFLNLWFVCLNHEAQSYKLQNKSRGGWNWELDSFELRLQFCKDGQGWDRREFGSWSGIDPENYLKTPQLICNQYRNCSQVHICLFGFWFSYKSGVLLEMKCRELSKFYIRKKNQQKRIIIMSEKLHQMKQMDLNPSWSKLCPTPPCHQPRALTLPVLPWTPPGFTKVAFWSLLLVD